MNKELIKIANLSGDEQTRQAAEIYYHSFIQKIHHMFLFTEDKTQAIRLIETYLNKKGNLCATQAGKVVGVMGIHYPGTNIFHHDVRPLMREFGIFGGLWRGIWNLITDIGNSKRNELYIAAIAVDQNCRGLGIGTLLMRRAFEIARENNLPYVTLNVVDSNPRAQKLYEKLGFKIVKTKSFGKLFEKAGFSGFIHMKAQVNSFPF